MRLWDSSKRGLKVEGGDENWMIYSFGKSVWKIFKEGFINSMVDGIIRLRSSEIEEEARRDINDALTKAQEKVVDTGTLQDIFHRHGITHPGKFLDEKWKTAWVYRTGKIAGIRTKNEEGRKRKLRWV